MKMPGSGTHPVATETTKRSVLIVASLTAFFTPFMAAATNVALPAIQATFRMDAILLSWVATSYLLSTAVFLVPFGRIADIYGRKKVFVCGLSIFTVSSLLVAVSSSAHMLLACRVLQGLGGSMIFTTGMALLTSVFPPGERGRVIGVNVAAVYVGLSAGPFLGGILTELFSWRSVFALPVPLGMITIYLSVYRLTGEWAEARGEKLDVVGAVLYGAAITLIMCGVSGLPSMRSTLCIIGGLILLAVFVKWELHVEYPVFTMELFRRNRVFAFSSLAALIHYASTFAISFLMSLYLQYIKGLDPKTAGLVLVAQPVMMALLSPFAGRLSDRIEPRRVASIGMALTGSGLLLLGLVDARTSILRIVLTLLLIGFGFALFSSPNMNAIMSSVERKFFGIAAGAVAAMRLLGQMFSMGIATLILSLYMGRVQITPDVYNVFLKCLSVVFGIMTVLCVFGIAASLARGDMGDNRSEKM